MSGPVRVCCVLLLLASTVSGQQPTFRDTLLDQMQGQWILQGTIAGKKTTHDVTAEWILAHQYLWIRETSREKNAEGEPAYQAHVYIAWDQVTSQYVCLWLDDFGGISTQSMGHATRADDALPFIFKNRSGKGSFHTTFTYDRKADRWSWHMDAENAGKRAPFARVTLTRKQ